MAQSRTTGRETAGRIGSTARVRGRVHGDGDLVVEGQLDGNVALRGDLTVADGGSVIAESIEAQSVTIGGLVRGQVTASGAVRLSAAASVQGNLRGSSIAIAEGAKFSGRLDCAFDLPAELGGPGRDEGRPRAGGRR
jgi:cytoskeletal protein CcmA (bactofilin family)